ncbi:MAG: flagellar hook capping protein [Candidatus Cloacimonadota bacterium]|nr:MAG: flagellar hook capping protein [Candidatus Cloacimonadota bacterium]
MPEINPLQSSLDPTYEPPKRKINNVLGKDEFLQLMIVQLQHQDPLEPMDNSESIAQQAQFSSLEQMQNLNTSMESLLSAYQNSEKSSALSMIGKEIEGFITSTDADGKSETTEVSGKVKGVDFTSSPPLIIVDSGGSEVKVPQGQINSVRVVKEATDTPDETDDSQSDEPDTQEQS